MINILKFKPKCETILRILLDKAEQSYNYRTDESRKQNTGLLPHMDCQYQHKEDQIP